MRKKLSRSFRSAIVLGVTAALGLSLLLAEAQAAPTVTMGCDLDPTLRGSVRYRNLSNQAAGSKEIWIGASPLTAPTESDVTPWGGGKAITFTYDGSGILTTTVPGSSPSPVSRNVGDLGALNYLEIRITKSTSSSSINLNGVFLGSDSLGGFGKAAGTMGTTCWRVTGIAVDDGFTLTGTLAMTGSFGGGDSSLVQIDVGLVATPDGEGPVTSNVHVTPEPVILNGTATVGATVNDADTGGSTIASAEYSLNDGDWMPMGAGDGAFDAEEEYVDVTFTATQLGPNSVCVRGTDVLGNVGEPTCQYFLVTYKFDGFFSPVENGVVNVAKAGQAIPVKWRLTDANDTPIDDPASFAGLFSSSRFCESGLPYDAIEEEDAAGNSGLQYNGDGYWQFNWKTPKDYANSCRGMYVQFDSGATSPVVKFEFRR
jgi:hypothetical protein